jgi:hypothetical protein
MISIPRNSINSELNDDTMAIPHSTKKINAKYSARFTPTRSISRLDSRKYTRVLPKAMVLNSRPNMSKDNMPFTFTLKK